MQITALYEYLMEKVSQSFTIDGERRGKSKSSVKKNIAKSFEMPSSPVAVFCLHVWMIQQTSIQSLLLMG